MISLRWLGLIALVALMAAPNSRAVEPRTEHTFKLSEGEEAPAATLADASWLAGSWKGTAFGSQFEEAWSVPSAGSMVGYFKLFKEDEGVSFYELMTLTVDGGTLSLKVKHFNADFTAWEDKAEFVNFKLVKVEQEALHFSGLSFYRRDENHIDAFIVMRNGDEVTEHELKYVRDGVGLD